MARDHSNLAWTRGAPPVQNLITEWQETVLGRLRIGDWYVYDCQMRHMIGLDLEGPEVLIRPMLEE